VEELSAGRLDLAFVGNACPELHDRFEVRTVRRVPLAVAVNQSSGTARRRGGVDLAGLAGENFLGFDEKKFPGRNTLICDLCRAAGFTPALETRADSLTSLLALVGAGRGIALIPEDAASLPHPQVAFVGLKSPRASVDWSVVLRKDGANRLAGEFVSLLTKAE
jgi:DNA-binding transcriptional LysR family regulator